MRNYEDEVCLIRLSLQENVPGKIPPGRLITRWVYQLTQMMTKTIFHAIVHETQYREL